MTNNKLSCAKCGRGLNKIEDIKTHECSKIRLGFHCFLSKKLSWLDFSVLVIVAFSDIHYGFKIMTYMGLFIVEDFVKVLVMKRDVLHAEGVA